MSTSTLGVTPLVLFAYARPQHLQRTLDCLKQNRVPIIYAFSDGPKTPAAAAGVEEVRAMLRAVDWCEMRLIERESNLGLGLSIRTGVGEVLANHESLIVCEDDLLCTPGAYEYLCAGLNRYRDEPRVMSVTGWTHRRVLPPGVGLQPYFDGRAECLLWGAWRRSWVGMEQDALSLIEQCKRSGIDPYSYGADLVAMAERERVQNIWAVRFLFLHILKGGLCLRPPRSLVEHIGYDAQATNAASAGIWADDPLQPCPPLPTRWPDPVVNPACSRLWRASQGGRPRLPPRVRQAIGLVRGVARRIATRAGLPVHLLRRGTRPPN